MRRTLATVLLLVAGAAAGAAAPTTASASASAQITGSQVTAPADGLRVTSDGSPLELPVGGGSAGGAPGDVLPLFCFGRPGQAAGVGDATIGAPDGTFAGSAALGALRGPCVLRALPGGFAPATGDPAPFLGPLVTVEAQEAVTVGGGPNAAVVRDLRDWLQQSAAGVGLCSVGSSGLCGGRLFDPVARRSTEPVFNAGGWIGATTGARSYLQVDGANAYPPARAAQLNADAPGLPSVTRTTTRNADGTATVVEADPVVRCNTEAFPPGDACTAFSSTGVRYERTSDVSADGTVVRQRDSLVSTDGRAHTVSVHLGQNLLVDAAVVPALRFGWVAGDVAALRATGTTVNGPATGPATLYVSSSATAPDGDPVYAQGAVTFDRPPASVRVTAPTDVVVRLRDVAVPAGGRASVVTSTYVIARTVATVAASAAAREDAIVPPTVTFATPKAGAIVLTPRVSVTGTVADNGGVPSLTVGGRPATVRADGRFSAAVDMVKGANTITAVATDAAGNTTTGTLKLTYQDRLAPAVGALAIAPRIWRVGRSTRAGFTLGEAGTLRIRALRPRAGRRNRAGTCVIATAVLKRARAKVCRRYVVVATDVVPVRPGVVRVPIGPKLGGRTVAAGRIRLSVTVTDYARNVSKARLLDLVLRPPSAGGR